MPKRVIAMLVIGILPGSPITAQSASDSVAAVSVVLDHIWPDSTSVQAPYHPTGTAVSYCLGWTTAFSARLPPPLDHDGIRSLLDSRVPARTGLAKADSCEQEDVGRVILDPAGRLAISYAVGVTAIGEHSANVFFQGLAGPWPGAWGARCFLQRSVSGSWVVRECTRIDS